jgi:hypothetical protein
MATASKSIKMELIPLLRSKSKLVAELNPMRAAVSVDCAVAGSRPIARATECDTETDVAFVLPVLDSIGREIVGNI